MSLCTPSTILGDFTYGVMIFTMHRYGGWTFHTGEDNSGAAEATVWYDNRAFHSSPSYLNALSNMLLRAAVRTYTTDQQVLRRLQQHLALWSLF